LDNVLSPSFNLVPSMQIDIENRKRAFNRLLEEQANLLNYLEEQNNAVINGVAGTGKTMIALEKARRHADNGEKVLFLCFNNKLKDFISENYPYENVAFILLMVLHVNNEELDTLIFLYLRINWLKCTAKKF